MKNRVTWRDAFFALAVVGTVLSAIARVVQPRPTDVWIIRDMLGNIELWLFVAVLELRGWRRL